MPKHSELDFPHTAAWCDDCFAEEQRSRQTAELRRANDLKEHEILLRENPHWGEWVEDKQQAKPKFIPPPTLPMPSAKPIVSGGMSVTARHRSTNT